MDETIQGEEIFQTGFKKKETQIKFKDITG